MRTKLKISAFTVVELLVVVSVLFILVVIFLPGALFEHRRGHGKGGIRINCVNNLKQVGLAYRLWSSDNGDKYPVQFFTNQMGGLLYADATNGFRYYQAMSNELSTPKILVCPADTKLRATNFTTDFSSANLSYFIGLEADETRPQMLLSGDRNITNGQKLINGIMEARTNQNIGWTSELHNEAGNVGMADGSVQQVSQLGLRSLLAHTGLATNRFWMP